MFFYGPAIYNNETSKDINFVINYKRFNGPLLNLTGMFRLHLVIVLYIIVIASMYINNIYIS